MFEIKNYADVENLTEQEAKEKATKIEIIKGYNSYYIDTKTDFGVVLVVYGNNKQIYNDSSIHYNYYIKNKENFNIYEKLQEVANEKIFSVEELKKLDNKYYNYYNKKHFILNNFVKMFDVKSCFTEFDKNIYKYNFFLYYFKNENDITVVKEIWEGLKSAFNKKLNNNKQFKNSMIKFELSNHEAYYCYEGYDEASEILQEYNITVDEIYAVYKKEMKKHKDW